VLGVPEKKLYFGQRPYITEKYSVNAIFLLIYNECRIKRKAVMGPSSKPSSLPVEIKTRKGAIKG
jgi:hypothetical protein